MHVSEQNYYFIIICVPMVLTTNKVVNYKTCFKVQQSNIRSYMSGAMNIVKVDRTQWPNEHRSSIYRNMIHHIIQHSVSSLKYLLTQTGNPLTLKGDNLIIVSTLHTYIY